MRLCVKSKTVHEVMCEQYGYACENNESSKRKMEGCNRTMVTKREQGKEKERNHNTMLTTPPL